jgi:hypothetical protein
VEVRFPVGLLQAHTFVVDQQLGNYIEAASESKRKYCMIIIHAKWKFGGISP